MLVLLTLVALLVGGSPTAGVAQMLPGTNDRGHDHVARPAEVSRGSWSWPLPAPHGIARAYLAPPTPYAAGHRGIDIHGSSGSPVVAPDDGVVHFAGFLVDRPVLSIAHGGGVLSSFEPVSTTLTTGDRVTRGQVIGTLLDGHCATTCLHLGARVHGAYVNPLLFLGGMPWSVLLPAR